MLRGNQAKETQISFHLIGNDWKGMEGKLKHG